MRVKLQIALILSLCFFLQTYSQAQDENTFQPTKEAPLEIRYNFEKERNLPWERATEEERAEFQEEWFLRKRKAMIQERKDRIREKRAERRKKIEKMRDLRDKKRKERLKMREATLERREDERRKRNLDRLMREQRKKIRESKRDDRR